MNSYNRELINYLSGFLTERRLSLFRRVLERRTRYLTVLLEDIYQPQNASAVLRTCDCTGIQDVHIVEQRNEYVLNPDVALGSDQWLTLRYYRDGDKPLKDAADTLRTNGYRIVATSPHRRDTTPESFNLERGKAVFMFGTELKGLTEKALGEADEFIRIPMAGFTESYNISVSAAIILYILRGRLERSGIDWKLGRGEKNEILLDWLKKSIKRSGLLEEEFRRRYESKF